MIDLGGGVKSRLMAIESRHNILGKGRFLILLLAADLMFMVLDSAYRILNIRVDERFLLYTDRGYAETYQYVKEFWCAILLGWRALSDNFWFYAGWSLLFGYIMVDDWLTIHEKLGFFLGKRLSYPRLGNLRPDDFGELTVFAMAGLLFGLWIVLATWRVGPRERAICFRMARLFGWLILFAVVADLVHQAFYPAFESVLSLVEEGGEMVVTSLLCWTIYSHLGRME